MHDPSRTNQELLEEISALKQKIQELEQSESVRKQVEEALQKNEEKYRSIFENAVEGIFQTTTDGRFLSANPALARILGYDSPDDLMVSVTDIGRQLYMSHNVRGEHLRLINEKDEVNGYETPLQKKDGSTCWVSINTRRVQDDVDSGRSYEGSVVDITERKRAKEELRESEDNFRRSLEGSPMGVRIVSKEGETIYANQAILDIYGYNSIDELKAIPIEKRYTKESQAEHQIRKEKRKQGDNLSSAYEISIVREDGGFRHLQVLRKDILWDGEGHDQVIYQDITERKQAEASLREERRRLGQMIEYLPDATVVIDSDAKVIAWNRAIEEMTGIPKAQMIGKGDYQYAIPFYGERRPILLDLALLPDNDYLQGHYAGVTRQGNVLSGATFAPKFYGGRGAHLWGTASALFDDSGSVIGALESIRDITEQKALEKTLQKSEENYRQLFNNSPSAIYQIDFRTGKFLKANDIVCEYLGCRQEEITSLSPSDFMTNESKQFLSERLSKMGLGEKVPENPEYEIVDKDGKHIWLQLNSKNIYNDEGLVIGADVVAHDISKRKRVEEALQLSLERLEEAQRTAQIGNWEANLSTDKLYWSQVIFDIFGFDSKSFIPSVTAFFEAVHPDDRDLVLKSEKRSEQTGLHDVVHRIIRPNGEVRFVHELARRFTDDQGKLTMLRGTVQDVTDRRRAEDALRASEAKYRRLHDTMRDAFVSGDLNGMILETNKAFDQLLGYTQEELRNINYKDITPEKWHNFEAHLINEQVKVRKYSDVYEKEYRRKNGTVFPVELRTVLLTGDDNQPVGMWAIVRDITERKKAEEALRKSEARYKGIFNSMRDALLVFDPEGNIVEANSQACRMYAYPYERLLQLSGKDIVHPDFHHLFREFQKQVETEGYFHAESRDIRSDGAPFDVEVVGTPYEHQNKPHLLAIVRDITDRKRAEEELIRAHKLESLGVLAGGIAHDFNNLMSIVQGYIDLALMDLPPDHVSCQRLRAAMECVDQTQDLTSRLITFSRGGGPLKEILDIEEIIRNAVHRTVKGTDVRVKFDFMKNLQPAEVDELQMKQVFYNLTTNAVEAMLQGGNLTIKAENARVTAGEVADLKEGSYLKITFTDEGIGILEEHLSKIFDPYFTTKKIAAQKGLGLGLAVCYSVLKNHGGHITVTSKPGKGTFFVIYLPVRVDREKGKEIKKTLSADTFRVLIMDDEPRILAINRAYLERMGYEVTGVKDGQEAIDTYKKDFDSGNPFNLVMLDLTVRQGMGGHLAMEQLLKINPSIKAIIVSGYVEDPVIVNYGDYGFKGALKKPFKKEEMESLVKLILQRKLIS